MSDVDTVPTSKSRASSELVVCWQGLSNKGFFLVLLAAWLALFQFLGSSTLGYVDSPSLFSWMIDTYNYQGVVRDDALGKVIPFLVLGLFWWKRRQLLALPARIWPPALLLVGFGLLLHIAAYVVQEPRVSIVAMFVGLYGLIGLTWGRSWLRHSFFPFFLFIFCVPISEYIMPITFPLRLLVSTLTEWVSRYVLGIDVIRRGTQLFDSLGHYQYDIAAACSGIRSLMAMFLLALVYSFMMLRSPWKRLVLIASAVPLAVAGNLLRMLCIIIAAKIGGQSAGNYVHEGGPLGVISLLPYVPAVVGILFIGRWLEKKTSSETAPQT